jgi:hypothetical protein
MNTKDKDFISLSELTDVVALSKGGDTTGMELILLNDDEGNLAGAVAVHTDGTLVGLDTSYIMNALGLHKNTDAFTHDGDVTVTVRLENGFATGIDIVLITH